ncbi:hypothetical protein OAO20_04545 [Candidatus Pelagibacter ubique]|nr:hypothetical protein [Candidatus Pelagibacter ubique]
MNINFTDLDLQVLTNLSVINNNFRFSKGNLQSTITSMRSIAAEYQLENNYQIPEEFYTYDLPEFLNFLDLFDKPKIELTKDENDYGKIKVTDNQKTSEYYCSNPSVCVFPNQDKLIKIKNHFNNPFIEFELDKEQIKSFIKSSKKLDLPNIIFENKNGKVNCKTTDIENKVSNNISFQIDKNTNQNFSCVFNFTLLSKIMISNYRVRISDKKISEFKCKDIPLTYFIALEPQSEFDSDMEIK